VNADPQPSHFGRDLRTEFESPAFQANATQDGDPESFVCSRLVSDASAVKNIRRERQDAVRDPVLPRHSDRLPLQETRSVNNVRFAADNRLQDRAVIIGIVFQIAILNQDDVARSQFDALADRGSLAGISRGVMSDDDSIASLLVERLACAISRSIIDHHDLF